MTLDRQGVPVDRDRARPSATSTHAVSALLRFRPEVAARRRPGARGRAGLRDGPRACAAISACSAPSPTTPLRHETSLATWMDGIDQSRLSRPGAPSPRGCDGVAARRHARLRGAAAARSRTATRATCSPSRSVIRSTSSPATRRACETASEASLTSWSQDDEDYSFMLGMFAFGLEEAGHYDRSEDVGREAVERNAKDVWGIHAVVHTFEMQGRFGEGLALLRRARRGLVDGQLLQRPQLVALLHLRPRDRAEPTSRSAIYDRVLFNDESEGLVMEMLDASSLLWRLYLEGADESARWARSGGRLGPEDEDGALRLQRHARRHVVRGRRRDRQSRGSGQRPATPTSRPLRARRATSCSPARSACPVCRAIAAFGRGRYDEVVELLAPIRRRVNLFGGSHAQRDAVQRTLLEAALRAHDDRASPACCSARRISLKPTSPYNWLARRGSSTSSDRPRPLRLRRGGRASCKRRRRLASRPCSGAG